MELKIISLNLRYDKPDPDNNAWTVRRKAVAALLNQYMPDAIGTQEGKAHQLLDLHRLLPDYQSVGSDRTGDGSGERCAIFYRPQKLQCLATGDFFLSETPEIPGSITPHWGNRHPRITTWAVFNVIGQNRRIVIFNTHLDYDSVKARELGANLICDRLGSFNVSDAYYFLTGDFNTAANTTPREAFLRQLPNGLQLSDALFGLKLEEQMTYHEFTGKGFAAVDTIYYDSRVQLHKVKIDSASQDGIWVSDHFPVIAFIDLPT